jgi:hypothetical protein
LSQPLRGSSRGTLVGYSAAGPPLYSFAGEALQRTSHSLLTVLRNGLRQIVEESDSRRIFYFLCINLVSFLLLVSAQFARTLSRFHGLKLQSSNNLFENDWESSIPCKLNMKN